MDESKYLEHQNETMGENSFMKTLLKKRVNQKGLTLIELLAVIVILAIIAAIAIPAIANLISNQRDKAILADASSILSSAKLAEANGACGKADATSGTLECTKAELTDYVSNIPAKLNDGTTDTTFSAEKTSAGVWSVTYNKFGDIKNTTKYAAGVTSSKISETALNENMNK